MGRAEGQKNDWRNANLRDIANSEETRFYISWRSRWPQSPLAGISRRITNLATRDYMSVWLTSLHTFIHTEMYNKFQLFTLNGSKCSIQMRFTRPYIKSVKNVYKYRQLCVRLIRPSETRVIRKPVSVFSLYFFLT